MNWKQFLASRKHDITAFCTILAVALVSFGNFNAGILTGDDWSYFVAKTVFGTLHPINLTDRRPLILALYYGLARLFGLQLPYYYVFNFLILVLSAFMVYAIVKRVFPGQAWLAGPVALVYLVYPVDYARTWLIMIYIRFWWLVSLGAVWLLVEFARRGKLWVYALALLAIALPLGSYEGQLGFLILASVLIATLLPEVPAKRKFLILGGVTGIGIAFAFWRMYLQSRLFGISDTYVEALQFNPGVLVERTLHGLYVFYIGWFELVTAELEQPGLRLLPWIALYTVICCAILIFISTKTAHFEEPETHQRIPEAKTYFKIFLIGFAFWAAGYFPVIALYRPTLGVLSSRVNSFAIPGAALMVVAGMSILAAFFANANFVRRALVTSVVLPLIVAGIFTQHQVQRENRTAWEMQKKIWKSVFATVPNLHDGRSLVVIIPGYQHLRPFESFPFVAGWEIEAGAQVLYNNPHISANYYYKDIQATELLFTERGFKPIPTDKVIPYKRLVFLVYDPETDSATLVEDLEGTLSLPFSIKGYRPFENILSAKPPTEKYRWLVK